MLPTASSYVIVRKQTCDLQTSKFVYRLHIKYTNTIIISAVCKLLHLQNKTEQLLTRLIRNIRSVRLMNDSLLSNACNTCIP